MMFFKLGELKKNKTEEKQKSVNQMRNTHIPLYSIFHNVKKYLSLSQKKT